MVDILELNAGDKVLIVDRWVAGCHQNPYGKMDHWLGQIMTVRAVRNEPGRHYAYMEEDLNERADCGWNWYGPAIECIISNEYYNIEDLSCLFE